MTGQAGQVGQVGQVGMTDLPHWPYPPYQTKHKPALLAIKPTKEESEFT